MSDRPKTTKRRKKKGPTTPVKEGRGGVRVGAGRPQIILSPDFVYKCAVLGMPAKRIADLAGIGERTIRRRMAEDEKILQAYTQGKAKGESQLHERMHQLAIDGDPKLLIWLSKNRLGYTDKQEVKADVNVSGWSAIARRIAEGKIPTDEVDDEREDL